MTPDTLTFALRNKMTLEIQSTFPNVDKFAARGWYEAKTGKLLASRIKPGDRCLDIGANVGYFSLIMADLVGPAGKVTAFEPDTDNLRLMAANIARNDMAGRMSIHPVALGNSTGEAFLYLSDTNPGDHKTFLPSNEARRRYAIRMACLDDMRDEVGDFSVVKMDVQGFEGFVLDGGRFLFNEQPRVTMITEFCPRDLRNSGYGDTRMVDRLEEMGFSMAIIGHGKPCPVTPNELRIKVKGTKGKAFFQLLCIKAAA